MSVKTKKEAEDLIYRSYLRARDFLPKGDDSLTRDIGLTRRLLERIGRPDEGGRFILVTGSKGKGSTARMIAALLAACGHKVGLFTSPHLLDFTERIRVNGRPISDERFVEIMSGIESAVTTIESELPSHKYLGPIGIALAAALIHFKAENTDINVIECGRGGRYDEANVLDNRWAVLTPIMAEHLGPLGKTIMDVAAHKIGIVKAATEAVIIGRQHDAEVMRFLRGRLSEKNARVFAFGEAMQAVDVRMDRRGTHFKVWTDQRRYGSLDLALLGSFQADNAAVAIKTCEAVEGRALEAATVRRVMKDIEWPGRCELIGVDPAVLLDGAIHRRSAEYVEEVIRAMGVKDVVTVAGVSRDKDYEGVYAVCARFSRTLIVTEPERSHKAFPPDALAAAARCGASAESVKPLYKALERARALAPELILVVGTQTFLAEARRLLRSAETSALSPVIGRTP